MLFRSMSNVPNLTDAQVKLALSFIAREELDLPRPLAVSQRYSRMLYMVEAIDGDNIAYDAADLRAVRSYFTYRLRTSLDNGK